MSTKVIHKYMIKKLAFPVDGIYTHNVQCWTSINGGKTFAYCGHGKFCRSLEEAEAYRAEKEALEPAANVKEQEAPQPLPDGIYYYFECLEALENDGLFPKSKFMDDAEAVRMAADYEASLYKYEFKSGTRVGSSTLYEPAFL